MYVAVIATAFVTVVVKLTPIGRRFEGVGANGTGALHGGDPREAPQGRRLHLGAGPVLPCGCAARRIVNQPTAHEGDNYLLPTVAAVVLGGTSLLGGRGNLVATAIAALFLSQLDQFVLSLGVTYATRTLVQAGALAVGIALYTIDWRGSRAACWRVARQGSHPPDHVVFDSRTRKDHREETEDTTMTRRRGARFSRLRSHAAITLAAVTLVGEADRSAVLVRPEEDLARSDRRLRREQLAARNNGLRTHEAASARA